MSKIKNSGLDQYGAEPLEQQQLGTAGVEGVNNFLRNTYSMIRKMIECSVSVGCL